jgi:hypothetical protein
MRNLLSIGGELLRRVDYDIAGNTLPANRSAVLLARDAMRTFRKTAILFRLFFCRIKRCFTLGYKNPVVRNLAAALHARYLQLTD